MYVCCDCCVLSRRGLCDELIIRKEEAYRLWRVVVCDLETSKMRRPWPTGDVAQFKQCNYKYLNHVIFYLQLVQYIYNTGLSKKMDGI